jgi:Metallo-beta-lactamase superfamily
VVRNRWRQGSIYNTGASERFHSDFPSPVLALHYPKPVGKGLPAAFGTHNFTRQHAVDQQLEKLGYKPADVRYVIYSHLHLDHAGGMSYFPNAVHVVQRDEIRYALWRDQWTRPVYCQNDFSDIRKLNIFRNRRRLRSVQRAWKETNGRSLIFRRTEASCSPIEIMGG